MTPERETPAAGQERPVSKARIVIFVALVVVAVLFLWRVRNMLAPFLLAVVVAAVLDPMLDRLQRRGLARLWSVVIVYILFFIALGSLMTWLVPKLINEGESLVRNWPEYVENLSRMWEQVAQNDMIQFLPFAIPDTWHEANARLVELIKERGSQILSRAIGGITGTVSFLINFLIMLIAGYYMLKDWPRIRRRVHYMIPPCYRPGVVSVMQKVGVVFLGYLRGLIYLCALYGASITLVLLILDQVPGIKVSYPFLLGFIGAFLYAVPYIGAITLAVLAGIVTMMAPGGDFLSAGVVIGVTVVLNSGLFDPILMPKILGQSTGLNPLAALFAVLAGAELFGVVGFILGVPVAASIAIVAATLYPRLAEDIPEKADVPAEDVSKEEPPEEDAGKEENGDLLKSAARKGRELANEDSGSDEVCEDSPDR